VPQCQAVIAAFRENDEEDHGEESASITLARCHKNSEKIKKKSSHEGPMKGTRWLHVLEVEHFRRASSRMPGIWYLLFCMSHRAPGVWRGSSLPSDAWCLERVYPRTPGVWRGFRRQSTPLDAVHFTHK
jgi:hypothetical protein